MNNLEKYKNRNDDFNFINFAVPIINFMHPIKYSPNGEYDNRYFLECLMDFVTRQVSWRKYKGFHTHPINGLYLNAIHNNFKNFGIYDEINTQLLNKYLEKGKEEKLKYQYIDSSFIENKEGSIKNNNHLLNNKVKKKNEEIQKINTIIEQNNKSLKKGVHEEKMIKKETFIDNNRYNSRKKCFKISTVTDSFGTPLGTAIISAKQSDNISIKETVENIQINLNTLRNSKNNRYKQYILADAGYSSAANKAYLKKLGYVPIIAYNKGNTKDPIKILMNKLTTREKKIYLVSPTASRLSESFARHSTKKG